MSLHTHSRSCYNQIEQNPNRTADTKLWTGYYLLLAVIVGAETLVMFALLHTFSCDLHTTRDSLHQELFPVECLYEGVNPADPAVVSCNQLIQELLNSAQKRLLLDVHNSLWSDLEEHNVTQIFRPAIQVGARPELNQYQYLQGTGEFQDDLLTLERLNWEALGGQSSQEGPMRLSPDAELMVPQNGIYFVYSQVQFETSGLGFDPQFTHCLIKRKVSHPEPTVLAKAAAGPPFDSGWSLFSGHQGALFKLERGDRLSLFVSNMGVVRFFPETTYFGAFRID
ncbi:tumor necrosis factor (ligand) superfamily, member 10 like 4 [Trichomycterus rosablanca]|uniref:tumor necrosis factor (ligand) superfamily, member 10 like 4 n=1 Tax=Trichomycterus rosablanca TaxID=2290929 RepID=UPI002F360F2A